MRGVQECRRGVHPAAAPLTVIAERANAVGCTVLRYVLECLRKDAKRGARSRRGSIAEAGACITGARGRWVVDETAATGGDANLVVKDDGALYRS